MVGLPEEYPSILSTGECENVGVFSLDLGYPDPPDAFHMAFFAFFAFAFETKSTCVRPADNESIVCVMVVITDRQSTNKDVPFVRS